MSAIFGIIHFDKQSSPMSSLESIAGLLQHRGPDGINLWQSGSIGLGHCMLQTTPESLNEVLPFFDTKSGLTITADARLDNRKELAEQLGITIPCLEILPDSQLILAAYEKWGVDCCDKLLGDFSFAIADSANLRFFCARDPIGIKPLYYQKSQHTFSFSSEIKPIVKVLPLFPKINESMVGEILAYECSSRDETLFQDVFRLPPAHYLLIDNGKVFIRRYWDLSFGNTIYYKDKNEYAEHFLHLFRKSVVRRMRSILPISSELSGGLDSSSIVVIANSIHHNAQQNNLKIFALVFPELPCDESGYISTVANKCALPVTLVPVNHFLQPNWQKQVLRSFHLPDTPNLSMSEILLRRVQASKSKVLLSGIGGDEWFTGYNVNFLDLFAHCRWPELVKEIRLQKGRNFKFFAKNLARVLIWPLIPPLLRRYQCKRNYCRSLPDWIPNSFLSRINLLDRIADSDARLQLNSLINASYYKFIQSDVNGFFLETLDRNRALCGVEPRYPFLDRTLIEFSVKLPEYQKTYSQITKYILRQGLDALLPNEVKYRTDKADFSYFLGQATLNPVFEKNITELSIANNGWINKNKFLPIFQEAQNSFKINPNQPCKNMWPIWFTFALEIWFKALYR